MVYGRYNELDNYMVFMGFINQRSHHWGAHPVGSLNPKKPLYSIAVWIPLNSIKPPFYTSYTGHSHCIIGFILCQVDAATFGEVALLHKSSRASTAGISTEFLWEIWGKTMGDMGKTWGKHGKNMGKTWGNHGKNIGKLLENGKSMGKTIAMFMRKSLGRWTKNVERSMEQLLENGEFNGSMDNGKLTRKNG